MKAAWYTKCGKACDVLTAGELKTPDVRPGEVRVKISTSGINPVDVKRRAGGRGDLGAPKIVPHFDGAGVIEGVGDGVPESRIGERVWLYEAQWQSPFGTAAELVVVPASRAVPLPDDTSFEEGACLGIPALTAHRCVYSDGPVTDKTVLVTGGAGAVGNYAIQFAKLGGARVITTVSSSEKASVAKKAGADHFINYRDENVIDEILSFTDKGGVDRVIEVEFGGNMADALNVLKPNGVIATYASETEPEPVMPFYQFLYKCAVVRFELVFVMPDDAKQHAIKDIDQWLTQGRLTHQVGSSFELGEIVTAHEDVEQGKAGKTILRIG